jgi:hypothetical protein
LAGSGLSLALAAFGAWLHGRARAAAVRLFALYLAGFGGMAFLAGLMLTSSEGGLHDMAALVEVPAPVQITLAITGGILLFAVMWLAGRRLQPPAETIVIPFIATMGLRAIVFAPVPWPVAFVMVYSSAYWLIAIASAVWHRRRGLEREELGPVNLSSSAATLPILLIAIVRWMVLGVRIGGE